MHAHQTLFALQLQSPLCNYRTMTTAPSRRCQQVIARRHLTVKGFRTERREPVVASSQVDGLVFIRTQECNPPSITIGLTLAAASTQSRNLCRRMTHFFPFPSCIRGSISIVCAVRTIAALKISGADRRAAVQ